MSNSDSNRILEGTLVSRFRRQDTYLIISIYFGSMPTEDDDPTSSGTDSTVHIDAKREVLELLLQYLGGRDPSTTSENLYESR